MDRHKKQKFDSIGEAHEAALISMGIISKVEKKKQEGPECPSVFTVLMDKYRSMKFLQRTKDDAIVLYPRDMLTWQDLEAYSRISGHQLTMLESELIMGIEGIFEGRDDG